MRGKRRNQETEALDQHVGSRVRLARQLRGLSQDALARRIGITFQQVQKYERGANRIGAGLLFRLGELLDVPVGFFYDGLGGSEAAASGVGDSPGPAVMDRRSARLVFLWQGLSAELQDSFLGLVAATAGDREWTPPEKAASGVAEAAEPESLPAHAVAEREPEAETAAGPPDRMASSELMAPVAAEAASAVRPMRKARASARQAEQPRRRRYGAVWDWTDVKPGASRGRDGAE